MARESPYYRDLLEDILTFSDGKRMLSLSDIARYMGVDRKTVTRRYGITGGQTPAPVLARMLCDLV